MKNMIRFKKNEFMNCLFTKVVCYIGEGSEGSFYKVRNGLAYKEVLTGEKMVYLLKITI